MSQDDIIPWVDNRERESRCRRSGGIGPIRYRDGRVRSTRRPVPYSRATGIAHQRDHGGPIEGTKVLLSDLDSGLCGDDIEEIFGRFGRVSQATVHYDRSGESLGTGTVTFERRADAVEAIQRAEELHPANRPATLELILSVPHDTDSRGTGQNRRSFARRGGRGLRCERRERVGPTANRRTPTAQEELDSCVREREGRHLREGRRGRGEQTTTRSTPTAQEELDACVREREGRGEPTTTSSTPTAEELDAELDAYSREREELRNKRRFRDC